MLDGYQHYGFGTELVHRGIGHALVEGEDLVWGRMREGSWGFWEGLGFKSSGGTPELDRNTNVHQQIMTRILRHDPEPGLLPYLKKKQGIAG